MRSCSSFASASSEVSIGSSRTGYETPDGYQTPSRYETSQRYYETPSRSGDFTQMRSPFTNRRGPNGKLYEYSPAPESDISFVSFGRPSIESLFPSFTDSFEDPPERNSDFSDLDRNSTGPRNFSHLSIEATNSDISSYASLDNESYMFHNVDDDDSEMYRLKQELKQTMEMYSTACKEALSAKQKALELQNWKMEEQRKLEEARRSDLAARIQVEQEKTKTKMDIEHAEAARRIAELDSQKRVDCEMKALKEVEERDNFSTTGLGYRRYTIEEIEDATDYFSQSRKIGEGGYGPVYQCHLDHTPVAVKVLRSDEVQGRSQFQQEVQVLSCIRHPNMVLLLGACPEYGCLVYEYMSYGSLEDRLMQRGNSPSLPWQHRFRIAAEITTGLLFLHHTKPEPWNSIMLKVCQ